MSRYWEFKYPRLVRWTHWVNFPILALMVWSGILIYWANDVFRIGAGNATLFHFFPAWFYRIFHLDHRLAEGMAVHFAALWIFALNGLVYFIHMTATRGWRELLPGPKAFPEALQVTLHDLGLSKTHPPRRRLNGAQQIAYTVVLLMAVGLLLTGLAIYKPTQLSWLTRLLGGYEWARWEHFWLMMAMVGFFVVHVLQVARAGFDNFRAMVMGWERVNEK